MASGEFGLLTPQPLINLLTITIRTFSGQQIYRSTGRGGGIGWPRRSSYPKPELYVAGDVEVHGLSHRRIR